MSCDPWCLCHPLSEPGPRPADDRVISGPSSARWQRGTTEPLAPTAPLWRPKVVAS